MKLHSVVRLLVATLLCAGTSQPAHAQMGGPAMGGGMTKAMMQVFGKTTSFTAKSDIKIVGPQSMSMPAEVAMLDMKMRMQIDLSGMKGDQFPPQMAAQLKQMGMDIMITISGPNQKSMMMIYPGLKSYLEMPVPGQPEAGASDKEPKVTKTELAKETVEGHPTVKNKVVVTDDSGKNTELTVWNATDLKDFPVRLEMAEGPNQVTVTYKDINMAKPDAKLFEAPAGYTKYTSQQDMMMEVMKKMQAPK